MSIKEFAKKIAFRHTRFGAPHYPFNIEPIQLAEIIMGIERALAGRPHSTIVEVGVARGMTSRLIAEHVMLQGYDVDFYCIDTFSSFTSEDVDFEVSNRGKTREELRGFAYNDFEVWKRNFADIPFVKPTQADAGKFDFSSIAPVSFCFLDVDLYVPTKAVLENLRPHLAPNAVVVVDDVQDNNQWDGAYQAFMEYVDEQGLDHRIAGNKCGIIEF